jgi:PTH2 family peptidyl-tRNA hydrolase
VNYMITVLLLRYTLHKDRSRVCCDGEIAGGMSVADQIAFATIFFSFAAGFAASTMFYRPRTIRQLSAAVSHGANMQMSLVVRKDLKMGTGKIAAQCAHAAVAVVEEVNALRSREDGAQWVDWLDAWFGSGSPKVVLACASEQELLDIAAAAQKAGLPHYVIRDAGRTQIAAGSKTVVAVGPAPKTRIDEVTSLLKLL